MKRVRNKARVLFTGLFFLPILTIAQSPDTAKITKHEFSIQQAVDYATKNNVNVKNALVDVQLQEQVNREITSNAYPHISANIGTTYNPAVATQVLPNFISPSTYQVLIDQGVKDGSGNAIVMPNDFGFIAAQFGTKFSASLAKSPTNTCPSNNNWLRLRPADALNLVPNCAAINPKSLGITIGLPLPSFTPWSINTW